MVHVDRNVQKQSSDVYHAAADNHVLPSNQFSADHESQYEYISFDHFPYDTYSTLDSETAQPPNYDAIRLDECPIQETDVDVEYVDTDDGQYMRPVS